MARQQFDINNEVNCNNVVTIKFAKHAILHYSSKLQNLGFHVKKQWKRKKICTQNVYACDKDVKLG